MKSFFERELSFMQKKIGEIIDNVSKNVIYVLGGCILFFLTILSAFSTHYDLIYAKDNPVFLILVLIVFFVVYNLLVKIQDRFRKLPVTKIVLAGAMLFGGIFSIWWVSAYDRIPFDDQAAIYGMASYIIEGNFIGFSKSGYLNLYPQQLGLIAITEAIFRVVGTYQYLVFQYINAISVPISIYLGYKVNGVLFQNKKIELCYSMLAAGCFPLYFYTSFVYGEVLSLMLSLLLVWAVIMYCKTNKLKWILVAIPAAALDYLVRTNTLILIFAIFLIFIVYAFSKKIWLYLLMAVLLIGAPVLANKGIQTMYEIRSGYEVDGGIPHILWVAMGMQNGFDGASGSFNNFCVQTYYNVDCNQTLATEAAIVAIKERFHYFTVNPKEGLMFYARKVSQEWNDPAYNSVVLNTKKVENPEGLLKELINGSLKQGIAGFMNRYQSLMFLGAAFSVLYMKKQKLPVYCTVLLVYIIGGFIFTLLWEANSRYVFPFFGIIVPLSAAGLYYVMENVLELWIKNKNKKGGIKDESKI